MTELEQKISILIQEEQPITESEAQDLASLICELPEIKAIPIEPHGGYTVEIKFPDSSEIL